MAEELQGLLEKINKEGLEKAELEKKSIIEAAEAKAAEIVKAAEEKAAKITEDASVEAGKLQQKGEAALRQASRDVIISLKKSLEDAVKDALAPVVKADLDSKSLAPIVEAMVKGFADNKFEVGSGIEVLLSEADKNALDATAFAALKKSFSTEVTLTPVKGISGGVKVGIVGDDAKFDITDETVTELICAYLSPQLVSVINEG